MYTIVVQFETPLTRLQRRPDSFGWRAVADGGAFPTLKGAIARRRVVARKYAFHSTAIQTPGGHLIMRMDALDEPRAPAPPKIKKRKLTPRI